MPGWSSKDDMRLIKAKITCLNDSDDITKLASSSISSGWREAFWAPTRLTTWNQTSRLYIALTSKIFINKTKGKKIKKKKEGRELTQDMVPWGWKDSDEEKKG